MTKHLPTRLLALLTALSLSLLFTACGASSKGQSSEAAMDTEAEEVLYENTAAEAPSAEEFVSNRRKVKKIMFKPLRKEDGTIVLHADLD